MQGGIEFAYPTGLAILEACCFAGAAGGVAGAHSYSAGARYAAGVREILECWFDGRPIREEYLIVDRGTLAGAGAHSYSAGDATGEAARFKDR